MLKQNVGDCRAFWDGEGGAAPYAASARARFASGEETARLLGVPGPAVWLPRLLRLGTLKRNEKINP